MAASSSTATSTSTAAACNNNYHYNIFISHRGPEVKKTFASHLYRRLLSHGLRVFLDHPELQRGDSLTPQIEGAIQSASVHVPIFSPGYAQSVWCLKELVLMLESTAPIIPVFYHVKPTELRWTRDKTGRYATALEELEKKTEFDLQTRRYDSKTIENWRTALSRVAEVVGFELEACNGDEGELVDEVVERVLKKVKKLTVALEVAKYPTGLDDKVKDFENLVLLQQEQRGKPQIFGIVGLGGVGKTTLAKEFFNRKNSDHSKSCFLFDVRDNASCLISLQKRLFKSLTGYDETIESVDAGIVMLRTHLSSVDALVILDDVDDVHQVEALLPHQTVLHSDSLILITSRNRDVLIGSKVGNTSIYKLTGLDTQHSLELFCSHAFNQPYPPPGFEYLVEKFLETCEGLPLSLKVFGALLYDQDISYCEEQLESLQQILPSTEIHKRFKISYNSLNKEEQQIFLDIACFLRGERKDMAIRIWDGSGWKGKMGFQNLDQSKSLVEVNSENHIHMHDHLRDTGREIAEDSGLPRRLWRWTENPTGDLWHQSSAILVRGLRMDISEYNDIGCDDALGGILMRRLLLLDTEDFLLERILSKVQSPNLIWLRWNKCHFSSLPPSISMKNLRVLQVFGSKLEALWEEEWQPPLQLRELEIDGPIWNIPKSIGQLKQLERIVLHSCYLTKLPEELCLLQSLKILVFENRWSSHLERLPDSFGQLSNLSHIELSACGALTSLPDSFGNLINLQHLRLSYVSVKRLPNSFGNLINLQELKLSHVSLETLPNSFGNLSNLQELTLSHVSLETLPNSFGNLSNLQNLSLSEVSLKRLPKSFGNLSHLQKLKLSQVSLERLPDSFGNLNNLQRIYWYRLSSLEKLPDSFGNLSNLQYIKLIHCDALKMLPKSFGNLSNLRHIELCGFNCLERIPGLVQLTKLQELSVDMCSELKTLEGIEYCMSLRRVYADDCPKLQWSAGVVEQLRQRLTDLTLEEVQQCRKRKLFNQSY